MLRLQMQGLLLLSLVLLLLLLSFSGGTSSNVDSSSDAGSGTQSSSLEGKADPLPVSGGEFSKARFNSSDQQANLEAKSSRQQASGEFAKADQLVSSGQSSTHPTGLPSKQDGVTDDDQIGDAGAELIQSIETLAVQRIDDHLLICRDDDLTKYWGRTVAQRIARELLPTSKLGALMRGQGMEDLDNDFGEESDPIDDGLARTDVEPALADLLRTPSFLLADLEVEANLEETVNSLGLVRVTSAIDQEGASETGHFSLETQRDRVEEVSVNEDIPSDLYGSGFDEFEPIVQTAISLSDNEIGSGARRPSSLIAMTQLQSPIPGTTGPLAPTLQVGPGAGPTVNFPAAPNQGNTTDPPAASSTESNSSEAASPTTSTPSQQPNSQSPTESSSEEEAESTEEESPEEESPPEAVEGDSNKRMISELVGSGYGFFGSVFDSGFYVANEFTFLTPKTVGNVKVGVTDMLEETTVSQDTDAGMGFGNRLTMGVRGRNAGLQCQYWTFASDQVTSESWHDYQPIPRFITSSSAALETVDLEITQRHALFGCQLESSFGGRYAEYDGQESAALVDQLHDSLELTGLARATRYLRGAGPTLGLSGRKNLRLSFGENASDLLPHMECDDCGLETCVGSCDSWRCAHPSFPWSLYWNGRIAWLWAEESSGTVTEATVNYDGGDGGATTARSRDKALIFDDRDSSIFTLGFQIGIEYIRPVFSRSQLMARVGFEYQHWDLGKNIAESQSFAFLSDNTNFGGRVDALAKSDRNYLELSGFTLLVGLNY